MCDWSCISGSSGMMIALAGDLALSSLGAGEGRLGCGVVAEGVLDCNAATADIGVGTCAV
jgi:hypothetical protein